MHRQYGAYLAATLTGRVVDKYPELIFRVPFVRALFPDAKFLFIARNGWDICGSIKSWSARLGSERGDETHDWWGANGRKWHLLVDQIVPEHPDLDICGAAMREWQSQKQRAVVEWIVTMREGKTLARAYPDSLLHIPYEELCAAPREWMDSIADFCDLPHDNTFVDYAAGKLEAVPQKSKFELEPCLETAFAETMALLGYGASQ